MGERILVTGASGQIGRHLVRALVAEGHEVTGLTRSDVGASWIQEDGAKAIRGNLLDPEAVARATAGAERIFHLAGGVRGHGKNTPEVINVQTTAVLLNALRDASELKSLVLASSSAVYGDRAWLWVEEDFKPSPNTLYGAAKLKAEELVLEACEAGTPGIIARIGAVYDRTFNFSQVERMQQGKAWLPGEGLNTVPVIHVEDCVRALLHLAHAGETGEIYHVADRSSPNLGEFYNAIHKYTGGSPVVFWSTWIPSYVQTYGARLNEWCQTRAGTRPRFTPDNLKLYTNSLRLKTDKLAALGFDWNYPEYQAGIAAAFSIDGNS